MPKTEKTIHNLKLHESLNLAGGWLNITRVPGGWVYMHVLDCGEAGVRPTSVFVPLNKEFEEQDPNAPMMIHCFKCKFPIPTTRKEMQTEAAIQCPACRWMTDTRFYHKNVSDELFGG